MWYMTALRFGCIQPYSTSTTRKCPPENPCRGSGCSFLPDSAGMGCEIYENTYNAGLRNAQWWGMRGGKALVYNNYYVGDAPSVFGLYRDEYDDRLGPGVPVHAITGQPQHVSESYSWNNMQGAKRIEPVITEQIDYGGTIGVVPQFDKDCWKQADSFNGSTGMGVGLLSGRPSTNLKPGVGYWATDKKTLYRATGSSTWEAIYMPYQYPHPLRGE